MFSPRPPSLSRCTKGANKSGNEEEEKGIPARLSAYKSKHKNNIK